MTGDIKALVEFQTKLQGVANSISKEMVRTLDVSDRELLDTIRKGLAKPFNGKSLEESMKRLKALCDQVYEIRKKAIENAKDITIKDTEQIATTTVIKTKESLEKSTNKKIKSLPKKKIDDIIKYQPFQGQSIDDWFESFAQRDKNRIVSAIQQAVNEGITPQKAIDIIRGTKDNDYKDGVLNVSRSSASMIARTITNGVANEARLATLDENEDVIDGVQFLATLDGRTSFICASLDGKIWRNNERDQVKRPPLHPNCRSTLIPYIELKDENGNVIEDETDRAAAAEDFVQKAKERYEANHPGKKWDDLAASTRDKYYYDEQKIYDAEHDERGASWKHVPASTTFKEYLESQPEEFQRSWLGEKRFELYKKGKLNVGNLVNPDSGHIVSIKDLGGKIISKDVYNKKHLTEEQINENMDTQEKIVLFELNLLGRKILEDNKRERHYISEDRNLPPTGEPNSTVDRYVGDNVVQRRFYDNDGKAEQDFDYEHGDSNGKHVFPHVHVWVNGERSNPIRYRR